MIKNYVEENATRMLEELFTLIRIPSVSAQPEHKEDMVRCANRWKELLIAAGVDRAAFKGQSNGLWGKNNRPES